MNKREYTHFSQHNFYLAAFHYILVRFTLLRFNTIKQAIIKFIQRGSVGQSHQNGYYLKQAMRKSCLPQDSNLQPSDYRFTASPLELEKTVIRRLQVRILRKDNVFALLVKVVAVLIFLP